MNNLSDIGEVFGIGNINIISVSIVFLFLIPILTGFFYRFSKENIRYTFDSLIGNLEFLFGLVISIYLTRKIFFENEFIVFRKIHDLIPDGVKAVLYGQDIITYLVCVPFILAFVILLLKLVVYPFYNLFAEPFTNIIYKIFSSMNSVVRSFIGALCQIPKAVFTVLVFGLLINFYSYYFYSPHLSKWLNESRVYQLLYSTAIEPTLNSNIAKKIPVILNDSFSRQGEDKGSANRPDIGEIAKKFSGGNIRVIEYFNGVTLDEAVKSTEEIDETARKIVGNEKNSRQKAYLIYKWITRNIKYDYDKAERVSKNAKGIESGSIVAFNTRKGICFDYSCLYISMCRSVGVKVNLVTGLGYSGVSWGDHAWNRVYYSEENRWIEVDTTFGTAANYFDKPDFNVDHKYPEIQGEW